MFTVKLNPVSTPLGSNIKFFAEADGTVSALTEARIR